ncbi:MAG: MerR family transcriptional regulator [bacterium]|nr:MerR family transcriptional regulator [bacterium]
MKTRSEEKQYYSITEVSDILSVKQYVLRYWETVFPALKPRKHNGNRRMYTEKDINTLKTIKHLLYEKKFTIKGANEFMRQKKEVQQLVLEFERESAPDAIRKGIEEAIKILKGRI